MRTLQVRVPSSGVRLLPPPALEPPFDDELPPDVWSLSPYAGQQLTIEWGQNPALSSPLVAREATPRDATVTASPAAWLAARRFMERCVEVFNGYRPAPHIRRMSSPAEAQAIVEQLAGVVQRTTRRVRQPSAVVPRRLRVSEPRPGTAEGTAVLAQAGRIWVVAFRLERYQETWFCTAFLDIAPKP